MVVLFVAMLRLQAKLKSCVVYELLLDGQELLLDSFAPDDLRLRKQTAANQRGVPGCLVLLAALILSLKAESPIPVYRLLLFQVVLLPLYELMPPEQSNILLLLLLIVRQCLVAIVGHLRHVLERVQVSEVLVLNG